MANLRESERKLKVAVVSIWADKKLHDEVTQHLQKDENLQVTKISFKRPSQDFFELTRPKISKMNEIGKKLLKIKQEYDLLIVLGLGHIGLNVHAYALGHHTAYPLYHIPGNVARLDNHHDESENELLNNANYVTHVIKEGLKQPEEITNYGPDSVSFDNIRSQDPQKLPLETAPIFDVDMDAFHKKYKMKEGYCAGVSDVLVSQFGKAVINTKPHTIGFFEYDPTMDARGLGLRMIKTISALAAHTLKKEKQHK